MKLKTLRQIIIMTKYAFYGLFLQSLLYSMLLASNSVAQKSVDDIFLSIQFRNDNLDGVFNKIQAKTGFIFAYDEKLLETEKEIDIAFKDESLGDILRYISKDMKLSFKRVNQHINVSQKSFINKNVVEVIDKFKVPQVQISGKVTSDEANEPLPGVSILIKGTTNGTTSDFDGNYSLMVSPGAILMYSYIGYETQEVEVGNASVINITLKADLEQLEEVIVIGYGTQKKENLTGAVGIVESKEIVKQPVMQTSQALMGTVPGVTVLQNSSQPGFDEATIRIRGIGTLSNSDPLVLIDGVPGNINGIDPNDIESLSVLKDAASASIYGSRAANGVIVITTKRGKEGKFSVSYRGYGGWQEPTNLPNYLDGQGYMENYNLAFENQGSAPPFSQQEIDDWVANHQTDPDHYPNTDWLGGTFTESGFQQHHNVTISGGNEMAQVLASVSIMDQDGNIPNFNFKRYQARINTDLKVSEKVGFNFDLNVRRSIRQMSAASLSEIVQQANRIPPIFVGQYSDGSWGPGWNGISNSIAQSQASGFNRDQFNYFRGIIKAYYRPVKGLELSLKYAPEYSGSFEKTMRKSYNVYNIDTKELEQVVPPLNNLWQQHSQGFNNYFNGLVTYEKTFGENYFKVLGGYELITDKYEYFNAYRDNFALQDYEELNAGAQTNMQNEGSAREWGLQSYFTRVNYDYKGKYLLEGNLRYDGSSRFSEGNKYGLFPSFSAGWRISEEAFLSSATLINELKIRGSWGQLGNQNIGNYPFASTIALGRDYIFGNAPASGAAQLDMANNDISWETTESIDIGLDLSILENRLNFTFDYFKRNTYDILLELPVPATIGLNAPTQNAGEVENKGWEMSLGWNDEKGDFSYGINFNISDVINRVTDLKGTGPYINNYSIIQEGYPINSLYGYKNTGFFQSEDEIAGSPSQIGTLAPGDLKYENQLTIDTNGDGIPDEADDVINSEDRVVLGDPFPRMTYGINLFAGFKGFDLSIFLQGVGKRDVYMQQDAVWAFFNGGKIQDWHLNYWTPDNPNAAYPRLTAGTTGNNYQVTDFWMWSSAYLRMRNLTIGYNFPTSVLEKAAINKLRIYFSGQNLFTLDDMPQGYDPEAPNGVNGTLYPITAVYTFGLDLSF